MKWIKDDFNLMYILDLLQLQNAVQVVEADLSTNHVDQRLLRELELYDANWIPREFQDPGQVIGVPISIASGPGSAPV